MSIYKYCERCGSKRVYWTDSELGICEICDFPNKELPDEYEDDYQVFCEEILSKNPNFDPELYKVKEEIRFQKSEEYQAKLEYGRQLRAKRTKTPYTPSSSQYQPKCPTCGSPSVQRVTTGERVTSGILGGLLFSKKIGKTYKCNSCKHLW